MFGILKLHFHKGFCLESVFSVQPELHFQKEKCKNLTAFKGVCNNYNEIESVIESQLLNLFSLSSHIC